jgi:MFS family permease
MTKRSEAIDDTARPAGPPTEEGSATKRSEGTENTARPVTPPVEEGSVTALSRNRDYRLLWSGRVVSELGTSATTIAYPLLVLAVTGSAAASGLVLGTIAAAQLVAGLPAGALVDRWNRKRVMLGCETAQALAAGSLVAAVWWHVVTVAHLIGVAAVIGVCSALFEPAEDASLPTLVPEEQVASAVAMNSARASLGHLAGTSMGGFLFAVGRFVPFVADLLAHLMALLSLAFVRLPPRPARAPAPVRHLGREIGTGLAWMWRHRHLRVTAICAVVLNLFFSAFYLVVIVLAKDRGIPAGEIGIMAAMLGAGGILGALAAPVLQRRMTPYVSIAGVFWALTALTPIAVFAANGYAMGALFFAMAFLPPTANTTIMTEQLLLTPDELRGRLSGVLGLLMGVAGAAGPVLGGVLTELVPGRTAILACAAGITGVTVLVTVNATLRHFPSRERLGKVPAEVS